MLTVNSHLPVEYEISIDSKNTKIKNIKKKKRKFKSKKFKGIKDLLSQIENTKKDYKVNKKKSIKERESKKIAVEIIEKEEREIKIQLTEEETKENITSDNQSNSTSESKVVENNILEKKKQVLKGRNFILKNIDKTSSGSSKDKDEEEKELSYNLNMINYFREEGEILSDVYKDLNPINFSNSANFVRKEDIIQNKFQFPIKNNEQSQNDINYMHFFPTNLINDDDNISFMNSQNESHNKTEEIKSQGSFGCDFENNININNILDKNINDSKNITDYNEDRGNEKYNNIFSYNRKFSFNSNNKYFKNSYKNSNKFSFFEKNHHLNQVDFLDPSNNNIQIEEKNYLFYNADYYYNNGNDNYSMYNNNNHIMINQIKEIDDAFSISNSFQTGGKKKNHVFSKRETDWVCSKCKNINFSFRKFCNRCALPK